MAERRVSTAEARASFKDLVDEVRGGCRIVITRYGKVAAYLVSADDAEAFDACREQIEEWRRRQGARPPRARRPR